MDKSDQINELAAALAKAQAAIKPAPKDAQNPAFRSHYASLGSVWDACRGPLNENGISVVQGCEATPLGVMLRTTLVHASGQTLSGLTPLAYDPEKMQSVGSALTYARRYGLAALVGVVAEEDDDGHQAVAPRREERREERPRQQPPANAGRERHEWPSAQGPKPREEKPYGDPKTGKQLWAWCCRQRDEHGVDVARFLQQWAKLEDIQGRMVDWQGDDVARAYAEGVRKMASVGDASESYDAALSN